MVEMQVKSRDVMETDRPEMLNKYRGNEALNVEMHVVVRARHCCYSESESSGRYVVCPWRS